MTGEVRVKFLGQRRVERTRRRGSTLPLATLIATLATMAAVAPAQATADVTVGWGNNGDGQLGNGTTTSSDVPVAVSGLSGVTAVSTGGEHSLAMIENRYVMAWGSNEFGQLGDGTTTSSDVPQRVSAVGGELHAISAGGQHSLAFGTEGITRTVFGWGASEEGQLGDTSNAPHLTAERVAGLGARLISAISAGGEHSLALDKEGSVMAFGANGFGQLGDGTTEESDVPLEVGGLSGVVAVAAGGEHSLALLANGTVMAWGGNAHGQLGNGTTQDSDIPVAVSDLSGVVAIAAGGEHSLALLANGTVMAWGDNEEGQLGNGAAEDSHLPVAVSGLSGVKAIAAGAEHSLALLNSGAVMAWGTNDDGELGDGEEEQESSDVPVAVSGLSGVTGIAAGGADSVAFGAPPPPPVVSGVSPNEGPPSGGTSVRITGSNLNLATTVHFGSASAMGFTVDSTSAITAIAPAGTGIVDVTVSNAGGSSATSSADHFSYLPVVTAVSPNEGLPSGGSEVTIAGTKFAGASAVKFGSIGAFKFTVNSDSSITALVPPGTGTVDVTVATPGGTSATSSADQYSYLPSPPPTVVGVSPNEGPATGGTSVTIAGTDLSAATAVKFGAANATSFTVNPEGTSITAASPAGTGAVDVTVTTPEGTSATSSADRFSYVALPAVAGVSPTGGPARGGTTVTITGKYFVGASAVKFGSTTATAFTVNSEGSSITAVSPEGTGAVDVTVTTPGGTSATSPADQFGYQTPPPSVSGVIPNKGPATGGTTVTITGTNFLFVTAVWFGARARSFTVISERTIIAESPEWNCGELQFFCSVHVTVTTPGGTSATSPADEFEYLL